MPLGEPAPTDSQNIPGFIGLAYENLVTLRSTLKSLSISYGEVPTSEVVSMNGLGPPAMKVKSPTGVTFIIHSHRSSESSWVTPNGWKSTKELMAQKVQLENEEPSTCLGIPYIRLMCPHGTAISIGRFYGEIFQTKAEIRKATNAEECWAPFPGTLWLNFFFILRTLKMTLKKLQHFFFQRWSKKLKGLIRFASLHYLWSHSKRYPLVLLSGSSIVKHRGEKQSPMMAITSPFISTISWVPIESRLWLVALMFSFWLPFFFFLFIKTKWQPQTFSIPSDRAKLHNLLWNNPRFPNLTYDTEDLALKHTEFRILNLIDPTTGEFICQLEHEIRAASHPSFCAKNWLGSKDEKWFPPLLAGGLNSQLGPCSSEVFVVNASEKKRQLCLFGDILSLWSYLVASKVVFCCMHLWKILLMEEILHWCINPCK